MVDVGVGDIGDVGGDVHDCVGLWDSRDGVREVID